MYHSLIKPCIFRAKWDILMRSKWDHPFLPKTRYLFNDQRKFQICNIFAKGPQDPELFHVHYCACFAVLVFHFSLKNKIKCYFL